MEINVYDYLSDGEVHDIVESEFRARLKRHLAETEMSTFVSNIAYKTVFQMVDERGEAPLAELLPEKVTEVIKGLTSLHVFHKAGYGGKDSVGQQMLEQAVRNSQWIIEDKVSELIDQLGVGNLVDYIADVVRTVLQEGVKHG